MVVKLEKRVCIRKYSFSLALAASFVCNPALANDAAENSEAPQQPVLPAEAATFGAEEAATPVAAAVSEVFVLPTSEDSNNSVESKDIFYRTRPDGTITFKPDDGGVGFMITKLPVTDERVKEFERVGGKYAVLGLKDERRSRKLEIAFHALNAIDAIETIAILNKGGRELNPLYGSNPSAVTLIGAKALGSVIYHVGIKNLRQSDPKLATAFQYFSIGVMGGAVAWNARILL